MINITVQNVQLSAGVEGFDLVICGHYHTPIVQPIGGGTLVVLGDWMRCDSYAVLENGAIALKQWHTAMVKSDHSRG